MYVSFIFVAIFIGYTSGVSPIIGYNYGAKNTIELKKIFKMSIKLVLFTSIVMAILAESLAAPLSKIFVGYNLELLEITKKALQISSLCFIFSGIAIFSSGFFTALNDGITSAIISFLRTLVIQIGAVIILPLIFKVNGIWYSIVVAEAVAASLAITFLTIKRKKYDY